MPTSGTAIFMLVCIDESGDLGWKFDKPYRSGGSSRYLAIACLLLPDYLKDHPKRIVRQVYGKYSISPKYEIKATELTVEQRAFFVDRVIKMLNAYQEIEIFAITACKQNVQEHIQADSNKLYNYMLRLSLLDRIKREKDVTLIPDPRTIKVKSGNSMIDYLQTELWFTEEAPTVLRINQIPSDRSLNLKFIDFISNIIWSAEENKNRHFALKLQEKARNIHVKYLFYPKI